MKLFTSYNAIENAIREARNKALDEAKEACDNARGCYLSRGTWLVTIDASGTCGPHEENCSNTLWETNKSINAVIADVEANHPKVKEICVAGGYDFATSVQAKNDGEYDPWVSEWCITIWKREA